MASYKVYVSLPAENDIREIVRYLSTQLLAPLTASRMLDELELAIESLKDNPNRCSVMEDERLARMGYRKLIVHGYIIIFTVDSRNVSVDIERILYARRDWKRILL